ncbi:MAG: LuxR C-terminal-related transcriptional regulator [Gemmatimonadaceae bacterium]
MKTVEAHRTDIMRKLRLRSVSDLVRYAIRNGIVEPSRCTSESIASARLRVRLQCP